MVHRLVDPFALTDKPVVDLSEGGHNVALDARLFGDLTDRRLFGGLPRLDVTFRQRPHHPAAAIDPPDECGAPLVVRAVEARHHQPAGRGLPHRAKSLFGQVRRHLGRGFDLAHIRRLDLRGPTFDNMGSGDPGGFTTGGLDAVVGGA